MFSSKNSEEKKRLKEEKERLEKEQDLLEKRVNDTLNKVIVFPGSKAEFEDFIGYKTEWLNTDTSVKGILYSTRYSSNPFASYDFQFQKQLVDTGIVAIVSANYSWARDGTYYFKNYFGIPVTKAKIPKTILKYV